MDGHDFQRRVDESLDDLKRTLYAAEVSGFEVDENDGALQISFDEPPARFVISPNSSVRQIWISALCTSFKLDWSEQQHDFVLAKTGEKLKTLVSRLITDQLGGRAVTIQ